MKTKFILHGGYTGEENNLNQGYFSEMIANVPDGGNMLLVYFASKDEKVDEKYKQDYSRIKSLLKNGKEIVVLRATEENFIQEVKNADVIYIRGGDTQKLKSVLDKYPEFVEVIKGKTISGSSAGAYVLSKYYFTNSQNKVLEGCGCIPVRIICHYESKIHPILENVDPVLKMRDYDDTLELILLKDYEWQVREI